MLPGAASSERSVSNEPGNVAAIVEDDPRRLVDADHVAAAGAAQPIHRTHSPTPIRSTRNRADTGRSLRSFHEESYSLMIS